MFPFEFKHTLTRADMVALYRVLMREYPPTAGMNEKQLTKIRRLSLAISLVAFLFAAVAYSISPVAALLPAALALVFPFAAYLLPANALKQQEAAWNRMVYHPYADYLWQEHIHRFDEDGFSVEGPYTRARFEWPVVKLVSQDDARTYLVWGLGNGLVVPHAQLPEGTTPEAFADRCRIKTAESGHE